MKQFDIIMPKLGESVQEATITKWFIKPGDEVEEDTPLAEIATDKVDSEIPSPVEGIVKEIFFKEGELVSVGKVIAVISLEQEASHDEQTETSGENPEKPIDTEKKEELKDKEKVKSSRFYSPLVKNIAKVENIDLQELEKLPGSGRNGRLTKNDLLNYLGNKDKNPSQNSQAGKTQQPKPAASAEIKVLTSAGDEIIEMDRMRRLIADHMVMSKQVSPHVFSAVEADVTNLVLWRNKIKEDFQKKYGEKLTFMPAFIEATAKALRDFPGVNASVDGYNIILRKKINIGIAVSLPTGNLIVPVIKDADMKNLAGLAAELNKLANNARSNKLSPDDIQGGTFTITNFGSFGNLMGAPIINQPQAAILATGTIVKKPAVIETPSGDVIAIRHKMYLSLSYDHRIVDGALGGAFLKKIADYLESFDINREV